MDFTLKTYKDLLQELLSQNYFFQSFQEFIETTASKSIVLRHDVDKLPGNSLIFAQMQHELGLKGSYYFRIVPESFNTEIIEKIAKLGHEIGYHYEDVDLAVKSMKNEKLETSLSGKQVRNEEEIAARGLELFEKHLAELRKYADVKTICMHGSPLSKYDNKLLWKYYNYKDYGIIGEPYFDVDFSKVLYLTDTGRRWDGDAVSIRDKVNSALDSPSEPVPNLFREDKGASAGNPQFKKTNDIIFAAEKGELPNQIMFTFHPQRWTNKPLPWVKELLWQNTKNVVKYFLNKIRS
jgi:hypothetical protein